MATGTQVSTNDRLWFTFLGALALHLFILLQLGFKIPSDDKIAPTLNITLATQVSQEAPEKADFLAQHNQEASGTADEVHELLTDQQSEFNDSEIREITPPPQQKSTQESEQENNILKTTELSRLKLPDEIIQETTEQETVKAQDENILLSSPEAAALQAKLDRLRQSEALQPKIKRIQTEATKASSDAAYLHAWNNRVEQIGNANFPQEAIDQKVFGTLTMVVTLNPNGTIDDVEIINPSNFTLLNQSALQMVHMSAPFAPIPAEVLNGNDKLEITRIWSFEITGLSTKGSN
ncbi:MAG: TonB family protein [Marinagarivorans sp.]|nr:TonB family protein [Marinagarivorans sp.]